MPEDIATKSATPTPAPALAASTWRKRRFKDALLCLSLANLCLIHAWFGVLFQEDLGYFNKLSVTGTTLAGLLSNLAWFTLLFWLASGLVRRRGGRWLQLGSDAALCLLMLVPLNFLRINLLHFSGVRVLALASKPLALVAGVVVIVLFLRWHRPCARLARSGLAIFLPLVLFTLAHIGWAWIHRADRALPPPPANPALLRGAASDQPRVVWIIFDELDRRLVFDQRPSGLRLPEFDRLKTEALDATNAFSPAGVTMKALPALIAGRVVTSSVPCSASDTLLGWQDGGAPEPWSGVSNVFTRARELGLNSGLAGWYHPYARVLGASVNRVEWVPSSSFEMARGDGLSETMYNQVATMLPFLHTRYLAIQRRKFLLPRARGMAASPDLHLSFLHLPVPHKPGVFDAATDSFTPFAFSTARGYFDNLALCDRILGEVRRALADNGLADRTWILVSSDHWWRESAAYDGQVDTRVPFILKAPHDRRGVMFPLPFNTVLSSDLVLAILRREVRDQREAAAWLEQHLVSPPKSYGPYGEPL